MRRAAPWLACIAGIAALSFLLPAFDAGQPQGISITRDQARRIADKTARSYGIPVERAWAVTLFEESALLTEELGKDPARRVAAAKDPVVGPRLASFSTYYFRPRLEKRPEFGYVGVGTGGNLIAVRRVARHETAGAKPEEDALRPAADRFVQSLGLPGLRDPQFVDARPTTRNNRIDHAFRYRVHSEFPLGRVGLFAYVFFIGDQIAGFHLAEENLDGTPFRGGFGEDLAETFVQFSVLFGLLLVLLVIFLRKYHAGEVGVGISAFLLGTMLVLYLLVMSMDSAEVSTYTQFGGVDAPMTALALGAFRFLFYCIPASVLVFLGWAVGESYARERWGHKLASFDAIFHGDRLNATAGGAVLKGLLYGPALAAAALLPPWLGLQAGWVHPALGMYSRNILNSSGGAVTMVTYALIDAIAIPVVAVLFVIAFAERKRLLWLGVLVSIVVGAALSAADTPVQPLLRQATLGFGGIAACIGVFMAVDLLAAAMALFCGTLLLGFLPYLRAAEGVAASGPLMILVAPLALLLAYAVAGLLTRREVSYRYSDLAPHVKRIVERERVKAEIDAANRIQAALLPAASPEIDGASVASHYRSATEIGGDYFDFLPLRNGEVGLAFGDVAGHGLTSGIVMAMAKAALLVQVSYDPSPRRVMEVLNETVLKTAPKRMMMTFFFGVLDPLAQRLRFSSAGHLDPYVYKAKTSVIQPLSVWGFPLGVRRRDPFREIVVQFDPGDRLILYSDGLIEAVDDDGEPFGFQRFEKALQGAAQGSADDIKRAILDAVKRFTRNRPPEDDQTLVVISFEEIEGAHLFAEERALAASGALLPN